MFPVTLPPSPETLAFLAAEATDEADYQADVLQARRYNAGDQFVALTDRLRQFLGGNTADVSHDSDRLRHNICRVILSAVVDKLIVIGFDSDEAPQVTPAFDEQGQATTKLVKPLAAWAMRTWTLNQMDAKQRRVHGQCLRDSEAFVLIEWDAVAQRPAFFAHQRFVDGSIGGDADGCRAFYKNDDSDQELLFVTKRWTEVVWIGGVRTLRQRLTIYYPDRIEKYAGLPGAWKPTVDADNEPWPIPWVDKKGLPIGIPAIHFRSTAGMEAKEAWPAQNAINYLCVLELTAADMTAFRLLIAIGWEPVDADGNKLPIEPGAWLGTIKTDAKVQSIDPADIAPISNLIDGWVYRAAMETDTPVSRFVTTKLIAAEGTQKEQSGPLLNKARARATELGNSWERVLNIARRIENTFGAGGLDEAVSLQTTWAPLEARDETAELTRAEARKRLGMPVRLIAKGLDLTVEEIAAWEEEAQARADAAAQQFEQQGGQGNAVKKGV